MFKQSNKIFNELVEQFCVENDIDPMKLLENEAEVDPKMQTSQLAKDVHVGSGINWNGLPRSKEPIHLMAMYRELEMKDIIPNYVIKGCRKKMDRWREEKKKTTLQPNPVTKYVRKICSLYMKLDYPSFG